MDTFKPLTPEDRERYIQCAPGNENSKFSFANGFLWQNIYGLQMCERPQGLIFTATYGDDLPYLVAPIVRPDASVGELIDFGRDYIIKTTGRFLMKYVCPQVMDVLNQERPEQYSFTFDRDNCEYIYKTEALATLSGRALHQKRNHINAFLREYDYEYSDYQPDMLDDCMKVQYEWLAGKGLSEDDETQAIQRALENYQTLNLRIAVIKVEGKIAAFSVGEKTSPVSALMLFEKALPQYNGLFQLINRESAARLFNDTLLINRGEDMGLPGLRQSKLSYKPEYLLEKYDCVLAE